MSSSSSTRDRPWRRRLLTIPGVFVVALLLCAALPVLGLLALLGDLSSGGRSALLRSLLFFAWVLACEIVGLLAVGGLWLARLLARVDDERYIAWNYAAQHRWNQALFGGMRRIYRIRYEVEGAELLERGGYLLLARHGSGIDYALPIVVAGVPYRRRIRYVLKAAMRWDPCLDVVGGRIPNAFVQPGQRERDAQEREVAALTTTLGHDDAINVYPEGSRYSPRARERQLARLEESGDRVAHARAQSLQRTLLPRSGAVKAILAAAPKLDVVLLAHHGLEHANGPGDLARGALLDARVRVRIWRIAAAELVLDDPDAWLFEQWARIDAWVAEQDQRP
jgi:1-acyl-sn-glycerol-3-phosphate acyltransferase